MISNASPLILFARINKIELLAGLYKKIIIPDEVYQEVVVRAKNAGYPDAAIISLFVEKGSIIVRPLGQTAISKANQLVIAYSSLDLGEAHTIALALQEQEKNALIDETTARKVAYLHGIQPRGSIGILVEAYQKEHITKQEAVFLLQALLQAGLRVGGDVVGRFYEMIRN